MITVVAECLMYKKAGKPWWGVLIPIYNAYLLFEMLFGKGILFLWMLCPIVNIYWAFKVIFSVGKVFGKGTGFGFFVLFLCPIAMWVLGFGKDEYIGPVGQQAEAAPVAEPVANDAE